MPTQESARHVRSLANQLRQPVVVSPHFPLPGVQPLRHHPYLPGTVILDLAIPLPELRKAFDKKWRNALSKAERSNLTLVDGSVDELLALQADLAARKGFRVPYTPAFVRSLKRISVGKFGVRMATSGGQTLAAWADVIGGNTATYLIGATTDTGRASNASYLLAYDALSRLKEAGARFFDLGGAGPASDGGTHRFKVGMGGDLVAFPGSYCFGRGPRGALVRLAFELRSLARGRRP
jgi:lipid II:glycine glycyltransferase (peptidoglycan interpeptide bridge formation enzyme)